MFQNVTLWRRTRSRPVRGIARVRGEGRRWCRRRQKSENVIDRKIEVQGESASTRSSASCRTLIHIEHRVHGAAVINHHALGQSGRAGGIDHVCQVSGFCTGGSGLSSSPDRLLSSMTSR